MINTGKIMQENPNEHDIDEIPENKDNSDLQLLKNLIK